jgi:hypothetical protein
MKADKFFFKEGQKPFKRCLSISNPGRNVLIGSYRCQCYCNNCKEALYYNRMDFDSLKSIECLDYTNANGGKKIPALRKTGIIALERIYKHLKINGTIQYKNLKTLVYPGAPEWAQYISSYNYYTIIDVLIGTGFATEYYVGRKRFFKMIDATRLDTYFLLIKNKQRNLTVADFNGTKELYPTEHLTTTASNDPKKSTSSEDSYTLATRYWPPRCIPHVPSIPYQQETANKTNNQNSVVFEVIDKDGLYKFVDIISSYETIIENNKIKIILK